MDDIQTKKTTDHERTFTKRDAEAAVDEVRLWGFGSFTECPPSLLFGELVKRTTVVTERYHGDLYFDARWLDKYVTGPTTFYWTARTYGTNIGSEPMFGVTSCHETFHNYVVELRCDGRPDDGEWFATFTRIDDTDAELIKSFNEEYTTNFATIVRERAAAKAGS